MSAPDCLDWLFLNPIMAGLISYSDLKNGTLNLYDLYVMNELLEYKDRLEEEHRREIKRRKALKNG